MTSYTFYDLLKRFFLLIKSTLSGNASIRLLDAFVFIAQYSFYLMLYKKQRLVSLHTVLHGKLLLRTRSSDLEVLMQHFVYKELVHPAIIASNNVNLIVDAGANIGFASLVLASLFPNAQIIAIELEENNFKLLSANCKSLMDSGRLKALSGALYATHQELYITGDRGEWSYFVTSDESNSVFNERRAVTVFTYDDICQQYNKRPDLIKMDIEGSEVAFLKDDNWCESVLAGTVLAVELHTFEAYSTYFYQLRKNNIRSAVQIGEYWLTQPS